MHVLSHSIEAESNMSARSRRSGVRWAVGSAGSALAALGVALLLLGEPTKVALNLKSVLPESGHAFIIRLPGDVDAAGDSNDSPQNSDLRLLEGTKPLGPAHSLHADIRSEGKGRYSHWGPELYFSSSDNSDPRTNGRIYSVISERHAPPWLAGLILALGIAAFGAATMGSTAAAWLAPRRRFVLPAALGATGGILLLACAALLVGFDPPTTSPDGPPGYASSIDGRLSGWGDPALRRRSGETSHQFVKRMTETVSRRIYHCDFQSTPRLIDRIVAMAYPRDFEEVGLLVPSALRCGWCNQVSYVLARALNDGGVDAEVLALNGHVVTLARFDGKQWIADPDFGIGPVQYPVSFADVEKDYDRLIESKEDRDAIAAAYATTRDDAPYFRSMAWLNDLEQRQARLMRWLEIAAWIAGFAGVCLLALAYRSWRKRLSSF